MSGETFLERCEAYCMEASVFPLTVDEELQLSEHECEGLFPSQAPEFVRTVREREKQRNAKAVLASQKALRHGRAT